LGARLAYGGRAPAFPTRAQEKDKYSTNPFTA
jgi:hypothetical protein